MGDAVIKSSIFYPSRPMKTYFLILLLLSTLTQAGPRTSTSYAITADTTDQGGTRSTSTSYTNDGSAGSVVGLSTVAAPAQTAKHGYLAQLTEVTALQLTAASTQLNESSTLQLAGWQALDDATFHAVPAASITWSVQSGPLASISTGGLATAATVYQNTAATAQGIHAGLIGTLNLTVLESIPDNHGTYAADGLGDDWQVQYFGLNNPNAAPAIDFDFDGHTNLFEFTAGLDPTSGLSRFILSNARPAGQPGQMDIVISPRLPGRTYTVTTSPTLGPGAVWAPLTGHTTTDNGTTRTITDPAATGPLKFYRVEITRP